jgi:hypothetical protein
MGAGGFTQRRARLAPKPASRNGRIENLSTMAPGLCQSAAPVIFGHRLVSKKSIGRDDVRTRAPSALRVLSLVLRSHEAGTSVRSGPNNVLRRHPFLLATRLANLWSSQTERWCNENNRAERDRSGPSQTIALKARKWQSTMCTLNVLVGMGECTYLPDLTELEISSAYQR